MRAMVVVVAPGLDQPTRLAERAEQRLVQQLVPQPGIEALRERVLHRFAGLDIPPRNAPLVRPGQDRVRGQLRAVVGKPLQNTHGCGIFRPAKVASPSGALINPRHLHLRSRRSASHCVGVTPPRLAQNQGQATNMALRRRGISRCCVCSRSFPNGKESRNSTSRPVACADERVFVQPLNGRVTPPPGLDEQCERSVFTSSGTLAASPNAVSYRLNVQRCLGEGGMVSGGSAPVCGVGVASRPRKAMRVPC
jgi:hypothetical protein